MRCQGELKGLTGVGRATGKRVPECWGSHLQRSVPPGDEVVRTVFCGRGGD
jgi:hypothetical protein